MKLSVGKEIPDFENVNESEEVISKSSLLGQKYVLFFYPKDDSPGCTKEACSVRDYYKEITKLGYKVFGVSPDKAKKHQKFIDKYEFQYSLLADPEKKMIQDFGLWGPKKFMGKEITGVYRTTLLVDEQGVIQHIIEKVVTKSHGEQVVHAIKELEAASVAAV